MKNAKFSDITERAFDGTGKNYLLDELGQWVQIQDVKLKGSKALRVWNKCMLNGHPGIAARIKEKYERSFPKSDILMAFGWAMLVNKNKSL
jgi:hypothetical protein